MSNFKIISPVYKKNFMDNPSMVDGGAAWSAGSYVTSDSWVGGSAIQVSTGNTSFFQNVTVDSTGINHSIQIMVKRSAGGVVTNAVCRAIHDSSVVDWDSITHIQDGWYRCVKTAIVNNATSSWGARTIETNLTFDACQLEEGNWTTYFDGDSIGYRDTDDDDDTYGYRWTGTAYESASERHGQERSGGYEYDLEDDLGVLKVNAFNGGGTPQYEHKLISYALLPGAQYQNTKIPPRVFDLGLTFHGTSRNLYTLHDNRYLLQDAVKINKVRPKQPFIFRYTVNDKWLEIPALYAGGLEFTNPNTTIEKTPMRMVAPDPYWRRLKQEVTTLTPNSGTTVNNGGGEVVYPIIRIEGTGSIDTLTNGTNGDVINFDGLFVFSEETIIINLGLGYKTLTSSIRGSLLGAVTSGSSLSNWALEPGDNEVTLAASGQGNLVDHNDNQLVDHNGNSLVIGATLSLTKTTIEFYETYETVDGINQ